MTEEQFRLATGAGTVLVPRHDPTECAVVVVRNYRFRGPIGFHSDYIEIDTGASTETWPLHEAYEYFRIAAPLEALASAAS